MTIPDQLREARQGLTQQQAADMIGCPLRTYQQWEQGRQSPPSWAVRLIVDQIYRCKPIYSDYADGRLD